MRNLRFSCEISCFRTADVRNRIWRFTWSAEVWRITQWKMQARKHLQSSPIICGGARWSSIRRHYKGSSHSWPTFRNKVRQIRLCLGGGLGCRPHFALSDQHVESSAWTETGVLQETHIRKAWSEDPWGLCCIWGGNFKYPSVDSHTRELSMKSSAVWQTL